MLRLQQRLLTSGNVDWYNTDLCASVHLFTASGIANLSTVLSVDYTEICNIQMLIAMTMLNMESDLMLSAADSNPQSSWKAGDLRTIRCCTEHRQEACMHMS